MIKHTKVLKRLRQSRMKINNAYNKTKVKKKTGHKISSTWSKGSRWKLNTKSNSNKLKNS